LEEGGSGELRVCVLGSGRMAQGHSRTLARMPGVTLRAVVEPDPEAAAAFREAHGFERACASLDQALVAGGFEVVVICTPNPLHAPQAEAALRAGKHVLCEIPLALSLADAERLGTLAQERDLRLMVCHTERYEAGRMELARRITEGEFHPSHILGRFFMLRRGELKTQQARQGWVDNMLWHHGCHSIDAVMQLLGPHEARDLHTQWGPVWPDLGLPLDVDLHWCATSPITGDEVLVTISLSHNSAWGMHDYVVIGREDCLVADHGSLRSRKDVIVDATEAGARERQDAEFISAVRERRAPALDAQAALPTMRILQAAWDVWLAEHPA
jgi:2-hydroxy-4-carboxymuconate semialdehyde hemiacetal dehydrogenase